MAESTLWWIATGITVGMELITGTFYLLMIAIGLAAAAVTAHLGGSQTTQFVVAAVVGGGAVVLCYFVRRKNAPLRGGAGNRDINLDIGETIQIDNWNSDGTASVKYRGAQWTAIHRAGITPSTGPHRIVEVTGSRLVVDRI